MGHTPDTREPQYHVKTRAPPTISLCHCPQNTTAGRVWLYTLLYGNSLYRLYATAIHPYTSFTPCPGSSVTLYSIYSVYSYTAIHAIQHTAPYSLPQLLSSACPVPADAALLGSLSAAGLAAPRWPRVGWSVPLYPHSRPAKVGWLVPYFTHCAHLWPASKKYYPCAPMFPRA